MWDGGRYGKCAQGAQCGITVFGDHVWATCNSVTALVRAVSE